MSLKDLVSTGVGICVLAGIAWGAIHYFAPVALVESRVEKIEARIELSELRLEQKIVGDQLYDVQRRIDRLEERNKQFGPCQSWPDARDREEYRKLQNDLEGLKKTQDVLIEKTIEKTKK